ncbi:hypothetical protein PPYR_06754 [Photinus pyralis]|uniref:Uncharacterized protein n=1 Tax=Photinus pyralis TaxID=7054 RepID=A0A1Y1MAX6_PHOPY|nr:G2/mitotic-specific cyclin-A-like [Photinus pyralis]KAB0798874.1 hypothetical protein PPYR_06754 [Photinus pyralis]
MATFHIHDDQENRGISEIRHKQADMAPMHQKRAVLGSLNNQNILINQQKSKVPLGVSNGQNANLGASSKLENQKLPPPVVPVAQFEAFKVYEDSKENDLPNSEIGKSVTTAKAAQHESQHSKEWFVQDKAKQEPIIKPKPLGESKKNAELNKANEENVEPKEVKCNDAIVELPMSVEKSVVDENLKLLPIRGGRLSRDKFFEIEEYRSEIYMYLRELELQNRPKIGYMRKQPDITYSMRSILVDWLVEVALEYKLQSETLFLAVNYIDRFLSYMSVVRGKLQLVGIAAMYIAAKYEEIYPPDISEFVYITDDTYNKKQVVRMEHLILKVLSFDLSVPTPLTFITAMAISTGLSNQVMFLAMYLSELAMLETDVYLETLPSILAAAAIAVARYTLKMEPWSCELKRKTGYEGKDFKQIMDFLYILYCNAPNNTHQAIREKYSCSQYLHVSNIHPRSEDIKLE